MKSFKGPKTQNEVQSDDKLIWESFVSREDSEDTGRIPHDVDSFGTSTDQSNEFMNDQELLNPLHKAAPAPPRLVPEWTAQVLHNWANHPLLGGSSTRQYRCRKPVR